MSNSTPRIRRGKSSIVKIKRRKYRDALPDLVRDFEGRCAYSCQHYSKAGMKCMEVDHFDPRKKKDLIQDYNNLFLATRHCNLSKGQIWPTKEDLKLGMRFLNPCEEQDYGAHIAENSNTHELVGLSPSGIFHIRHCDLNAPHFVAERRKRARIWSLLNETIVTDIKSDAALRSAELLREHASEMIPPFPYIDKPK